MTIATNLPNPGQSPADWKNRLSGHRLLSMGFPIYLIIFESIIRNLFKVDIGSFIGPSLAAGGLGLLIENVKPSKVDSTQIGLNLPSGYVIRRKDDEKLIIITWVFVLLCLITWVYSCVSALNGDTESVKEAVNAAVTSGSPSSSKTPNHLNWSFGCGIFNYLVGTTLSTIKATE